MDSSHLETHGTNLELFDKIFNLFLNGNEPFELIFIILVGWTLWAGVVELLKLSLNLLFPNLAHLSHSFTTLESA